MIGTNRQHAEVHGYRVLPSQVSDGDFNEVWDSPLCRMLRNVRAISHPDEQLNGRAEECPPP